MQIVENMNDREVKMKRTRRGKRSGRRRGESIYSNSCDDGRSEDCCGANRAHKDLRSVKWRKFYVRPRYSPTAPHNYTQFIMDDQHQCLSENLAELSRNDISLYPSHNGDIYKQCDYEPPCSDRVSPNSDREFTDIKNIDMDSSVFMANDFESFYNQLRAEELSKLSKDELIEEILCMEDKVARIEREKESTKQTDGVPSAKVFRNVIDRTESLSMLSKLNEELTLLKKENRKLKQEKLSISPS